MIYVFPLIVGCAIVLAMVQNGRLADYIGLKNCTLINFISGVTGASILFIITKESLISFTQFGDMPVIGYLGGFFGIFVVTLSTIVVNRIPIITSTMLMYTGQLVMGILIDYYSATPLSLGKIVGCVLIIIGVYFNSYIDKKHATQVLVEQKSEFEDANSASNMINY
jgi:transporter family-2 protein